MNPGIESVTTSAIGLALDAVLLRQQAVMANIANADAEGYTPVRVSFEEQLDEARRSLQGSGSIDPAALSGVIPQLVAVDAGSGDGKVQLDVEMTKLSDNTVRYQALIKSLNRHFANMNTAVTDGRK